MKSERNFKYRKVYKYEYRTYFNTNSAITKHRHRKQIIFCLKLSNLKTYQNGCRCSQITTLQHSITLAVRIMDSSCDYIHCLLLRSINYIPGKKVNNFMLPSPRSGFFSFLYGSSYDFVYSTELMSTSISSPRCVDMGYMQSLAGHMSIYTMFTWKNADLSQSGP